MKKIEGYDEAQALTGEYELLEAGGYICKIISAKVEKSKTNKEMLVIAFDIAEGEHKDYFKRRYEGNTSFDRKWPTNGVYRQMLEGENAIGYLKGLMTSLEASNQNFKWNWDESKLKGLKFGGLFGREQYEANDGTLKFATKLQFIRSVEKIKNNDFKIPEDKLLNRKNNELNGEFITVGEDEELPF